MADELKKTGVQLTAEGASEFKQALDDSNKVLAAFGEAATGASGQINGLGEIAIGALREIGAAAADFLGEAIGKLIEFGQESLGEALKAEQQQAQLAQSVKRAGDAFGGSVEDVNALALKYRDLAGGSDEAIVAIEQVGIKAGTVSKEQMPDFIKRVADLAAVTGDATSAATLLARAQDDPMGAFTRLERQTGVYDVALKAQIASMVKAGDTAGATAKVMDFVAQATGGAAAANADTMAGKWEILRNHFEDAGKGIMEKVLPSLETLFDNVIAPALPIVEGLADHIGNLVGSILTSKNPLETMRLGLEQMLPPGFQGVIDSVVGALERIIPPVTSFIGLLAQGANPLASFKNAFANLIPPEVMAVILNVAQTIQTTLAGAISYVQSVIAAAMPTISANVQTTLAGMQTFWQNHGAEIMTIVDGLIVIIGAVFKIIADIIGAALVFISGVIAAFWDLVNGDTAGAQTTMQGTIAQSMNMILSLVGMNLNQFVAVWQADFSLAQMILQTVWNNIMAFLKTGLVGWQATWSLFQQIISAVWHGMENTINAVMGQVRDNINGFLQFLRDALSTALSVAAAIANIATGGGGTPSHAAGGIAPAGQAAMFGEQGPEMAVPLTDMLVFPAAVTSQIMNMPQTNASNTTNWNYAPTYYSAPPQPSVDFAIMQVMAA